MSSRERSAEEVEAAEAAHRAVRAEMEAENERMRAEGRVFAVCGDCGCAERVFARGEAERVGREWFAKVSAGKRFVGDGVSHVSNSEASRRDAEAVARWGA